MGKKRFLILLITFGCTTFFSVTGFAAERVVEKIFPVNEDASFFLKNNRGDINIHTDKGDTIRVVATITHEDEDALDWVTIDTSNSKRRVRVEVEYDFDRSGNPWWWNGWNGWDQSPFPDVDLDITIPETISLEIDSHRGTMEVEAPSGDIYIKSHRGRGNITGIRSEFELDTHRGDFDLDVSELHDMDIKTHRGNVYAKIAKAENFSLRGKTHRGRLRFRGKDIEVERDYRDRGEYVSERFGNGENRVYLDTHRGDITLAFKE